MTEVFEEIAVSKIEGHADNPRLVLRDVENLAESIKANGLTSTPAVMRHPKSKVKFILLCGHRRLAALKQLRTKNVLVRVYPSDLSPLQQMQIIMDDNTEADALTLTEQARGVQTMFELEGFDLAAYAKAKKTTQKAVKAQASLAAAPPAVRVKLDAYQMTDEDYFQIREFEHDQETFAALVQEAGGRNFDYEIRQARRLRDLPGNLEASQAAIDESGCKAITHEQKYYSNAWMVFKTADEATPLTPLEHGARKHRYDLNESTGLVTWYAPPPKAEKQVEAEETEAPELSEEEVAGAARLEELRAGLAIAAELLQEHLKTVIMAGDPVMAKKAAVTAMTRRLSTYASFGPSDVAWIFGLSTKATLPDVEVELAKLTADQLSILWCTAETLCQYDHASLGQWDAAGYWFERAESVRVILHDVLGYEQISIETEALEHFAAVKAEDDAHRCTSCGDWNSEVVNERGHCESCAAEFCDECGGELDDGEGADGKCGSCADRAEAIANANISVSAEAEVADDDEA